MLKKQHLLLASSLFFTSSIVFAATPSMTWKVNSPPNTKIENLTFKMKINEAAPIDQFYYANQFGFTGGGEIGYIGMQPTLNASDGSPQFKVLFSSFRKGTIPDFPSCKGGADGSSNGATCRILVPATLGAVYELRVEKKGDLLTGYVKNTQTNHQEIIGQWYVDGMTGDLKGTQISWVENYKMNNPNYKLECNNKSWPYYEVQFFNPEANDGKIKGTISTLNRGSATCPGAITWDHDINGTLIKGGFK